MAHEALEKNEAFVFKWQIENYTLCPQKRGSFLESPPFIVGMIEKTRWHLCLYPRGKSDDYIVCELYREEDYGSASVTIYTQFSFLINEETFIFEFNVEKNSYSKSRSTHHKMVKREALMLKKHLVLPKDVLTIQLCIWQDDVPVIDPTPAIKALAGFLYGENGANLPDSIYTTTAAEVMNWKKNFNPYLNECSARTLIGKEYVSFLWPIQNFSVLTASNKFSVPLVSGSKKVPTLILSVSLISEDNVLVTIQKMIEKDLGEIFMICSLSVQDVDGRENVSAEEEHYFSSSTSIEIWNFKSFFKKSQMIEEKMKYMPNDILYLKCIFTISTGIEISVIEESKFMLMSCEKSTNINETNSLAEDIKTLYVDQKLFDVNLRVGNKSLPAHKAILISRSPVFKDMFEHDAREKNAVIVDIPDVDIDTLAKMIAFIYSNDTDNLNSENAIKLYTAAEKYQISALRKRCSVFLKSNVSSENVFTILILADIYRDEQMKSAAEEFLCKPPYEDLFSERFDAFMKNHTQLAREALQSWVKALRLDECNLLSLEWEKSANEKKPTSAEGSATGLSLDEFW